MNKKIIYTLVFIIGVMINLYNFTDVFGDTAIPKVRIFGTSTTFTDSTDYVTLNKGFYVRDSIKTDKDLIVKGAVIMDTTRLQRINGSGNALFIDNAKENGSLLYYIGNKNSNYIWYKTSGASSIQLMQLDTINGLVLNGYNLSTSSTGQIKLPSDTASDYDANSSITLNRQSGILTTASLTTTAGNYFTLTLVNSLITTSSKVFFDFKNGTNSAGVPLKYETVASSGSCTLRFYNAHATNSFNGTLIIHYAVFN